LLKITLGSFCLGVVTLLLQLALGGEGLNFTSDVAEKENSTFLFQVERKYVVQMAA
jgi:hypothetical protein